MQPTIQRAQLCQNYWLEKLKVILSTSSPSSDPAQASLFFCVSCPTCTCSVWPKAAPALSSFPPSAVMTWSQLSLGKFMPKLLFLDSAWMQTQEKALWGQCPFTAPMGYYLKSLLRTQHFVVEYLYKTQRLLEVKGVTLKV